MPTLDDLKAILEPDEHDLDGEYKRQPQLTWDVGEALANAVYEKERLDKDIDEFTAAQDDLIRKQAEQAKEKLSEAQIKQRIVSHPKMRGLQEKYLRAKQAAEKWSAMKDAIKQRSYSISGLADLYVANYYATEHGGKVSSETKDALAERARRDAGKQRRKGLRE